MGLGPGPRCTLAMPTVFWGLWDAAGLRTAVFPYTVLLQNLALRSGMSMEVMPFHTRTGWGLYVWVCGGECVSMLGGGSGRRCLICICTSRTLRSQGSRGSPFLKYLRLPRRNSEGIIEKCDQTVAINVKLSLLIVRLFYFRVFQLLHHWHLRQDKSLLWRLSCVLQDIWKHLCPQPINSSSNPSTPTVTAKNVSRYSYISPRDKVIYPQLTTTALFHCIYCALICPPLTEGYLKARAMLYSPL